MIYLIIISFILFFTFYIIILPFRLFIQKPFTTLKYFFLDVFYYFKHKKYNLYKAGSFNAYDSYSSLVFGSGKTLSVVAKTLDDFKKYDNKKVWDNIKKCFVTQKIHVLSNISFKSIPYEKLKNLGQVVSIAEKFKNADDNFRHCIIVVIDECQNQLHSRSFKDNISPMMLKQLTECRHFNMSIYYDSPKFKQVDALLRQCTSLNIKCRKIWRFQLQKIYDAQIVEDNSDLSKIPCKKSCFFITDDIFNAYDSYEVVDNLIKAKDRNDLLSDEEILHLQQNQSDIINNIQFPKKIKFKK